MLLWSFSVELNGFHALMLQVDLVVVLVVTMILSQWCSLSEAQLNPVEAAALFDLCDRPGTDLWTNCSDSANACNNSANWPGITCNVNNTAILYMCDALIASHHYNPLCASPALISILLCIRSRCCQSAAGGSIPASIGNMAQLQMLYHCESLLRCSSCLDHCFIMASTLDFPLPLCHSGCVRSFVHCYSQEHLHESAYWHDPASARHSDSAYLSVPSNGCCVF